MDVSCLGSSIGQRTYTLLLGALTCIIIMLLISKMDSDLTSNEKQFQIQTVVGE